MKITSYIKYVFCLVLLFIPILANATDDLENGNGDVGDTPAAPIENYLVIMAVVALFFVFYYFKNRSSITR